MANPLPNTTTTANFRDVILSSGGPCQGGSILIANNPVQMLVASGPEQGVQHEQLYPYVSPSIIPLAAGKEDFIYAVSFADFNPGSHAQVSGWLVPLGLAGPMGGNPFTQTIQASGAVGQLGVIYRQAAAAGPTNTVVETDLFGNAFTLAAGSFATTGFLRITLAGDWVTNAGVTQDMPRLRFKLGGTTIIDTGILGAAVCNNLATAWGWGGEINVWGLGSLSSQWVEMRLWFFQQFSINGAAAWTTGNGNTGVTGRLGLMQGGGIGSVSLAGSTTVQLTAVNANATSTRLTCQAATAELQ